MIPLKEGRKMPHEYADKYFIKNNQYYLVQFIYRNSKIYKDCKFKLY